ncbi:MAG: hypothetical protein CMM03_18745 [Rhodopirellula sp.]|nr:hypothetical protein [Rhodopirellula sp.]
MIEKKLVLGTANFGNYYGSISKKFIKEAEAKKIIVFCEKKQINIIETSPDYKDAEKILGRIGCKNFRVVTKIPKIEENISIEANYIEKKLNSSLINLKKKNIYALMFRNPLNYIDKNKKKLWEEAKELKKRGIIEKLGITIYDPAELEESFHILRPDLVQFPYNLFDRRIESSGWLNFLYQNNVETHCRSIFLQGLLLRNNEELPLSFSKYEKVWHEYYKWLNKNNINTLEACLNLVINNEKILKIVVGIEDIKQLESILLIKRKKINFPFWDNIINKELIDPRKW